VEKYSSESEDKTEVIKGGGALKVASIEKIEGTAEQLIGHDGVGNTHWRGVGGGVLTGKWNE